MHLNTDVQPCRQVQGVCEEEKHLILQRSSEFLGVVCKAVHGGVERPVSECVCVCVCVQRVCPECPCRGHAWVTVWAGRWRAWVRACGRVCRHTSPSPGAAPSAPCPVLGQVLSPFLCSGTARLLAYRPSLSILSVSFHLAVCSAVRVQLSAPIITDTP